MEVQGHGQTHTSRYWLIVCGGCGIGGTPSTPRLGTGTVDAGLRAARAAPTTYCPATNVDWATIRLRMVESLANSPSPTVPVVHIVTVPDEPTLTR